MLKIQTQSVSDPKKKAATKPCRLLKRRLFAGIRQGYRSSLRELFQKTGLDLDAEWVQHHIAACPRCQRRFAHVARVKLALSLMKSQPHGKNLLAQANTQAIRTLHRGLRDTAHAQELKGYQPEPGFMDNWRSLRSSLTQMAACIALFALSKIGIFNSIEKTQSLGRQAVQQYYAQGDNQDLSDTLFDS